MWQSARMPGCTSFGARPVPASLPGVPTDALQMKIRRPPPGAAVSAKLPPEYWADS